MTTVKQLGEPSASRVTLKAIAEEVGVSYTTVARALTGKTKAVWPGTAKRNQEIREAAARLGYRFNSAARATVTGRFNAVALLNRSESDFSPIDLERGICDSLAEKDFHMSLAHLPKRQIGHDATMPKLLRELCVDGVIVHEAIDVPDEIAAMVRRLRVPAVWINTKGPQDRVYPDDYGAAYRATRQLIQLGHRHICYAVFEVDWMQGEMHYSVADRFKGYAAAMAEAGLSPRHLRRDFPGAARKDSPGVYPWGTPLDTRVAIAADLLSDPHRPTAVVTPHPDTAGPIVVAALKLGIDIPRQLSVITFHTECLTLFGFTLSTMPLPMYRVGSAAVTMLMNKLAAPDEPVRSVAMPFENVKGNTIAPPASASP